MIWCAVALGNRLVSRRRWALDRMKDGYSSVMVPMRDRSRRYSLMLIAVLVAVCAGACSGPVIQVPYPDETEFEPLVKSEQPEIVFFADGTESMLGFTNRDESGLSTWYQRVLPDIVERAHASAWPGLVPTWFKFGTTVVEIEENDWRAIGDAAFYTDERVLQETYIDQAIDKSNPGDLSVVVTDLYQAHSNVLPLVRQVQDKHFGSGGFGTVGIIAIRSEFDGDVFDVGNISGFPFSSYTDCPEDAEGMRSCRRPFYLIVFGPHADVSTFYRVVSRELDDADHRFVHLTPRLGNPLVSLRNSDDGQASASNFLRVDDIVVKNGFADERAFREYFRRSASGDGTLVTTLHVERDTWMINGSKPNLDVTVEHWNGMEFDPVNNTGFMAESSDVAPGTATEEQVTVTLTVPEGHPRVSGVYRVTVDVYPPVEALKDTLWIGDWNIDPSTVPARPTDDAFRKEDIGPKTLNLKTFVDLLWDALVRERGRPQIGKLCYYIQVQA